MNVHVTLVLIKRCVVHVCVAGNETEGGQLAERSKALGLGTGP